MLVLCFRPGEATSEALCSILVCEHFGRAQAPARMCSMLNSNWSVLEQPQALTFELYLTARYRAVLSWFVLYYDVLYLCATGRGPLHHHQPGALKAAQQWADHRSLQQQVRWLVLHMCKDTRTLQDCQTVAGAGQHGEVL